MSCNLDIFKWALPSLKIKCKRFSLLWSSITASANLLSKGSISSSADTHLITGLSCRNTLSNACQMKRGKRMEKLTGLPHVHWNGPSVRLVVIRLDTDPLLYDPVEETLSLKSSHPPISSLTFDFDP